MESVPAAGLLLATHLSQVPDNSQLQNYHNTVSESQSDYLSLTRARPRLLATGERKRTMGALHTVQRHGPLWIARAKHGQYID